MKSKILLKKIKRGKSQDIERLELDVNNNRVTITPSFKGSININSEYKMNIEPRYTNEIDINFIPNFPDEV